MSLKRAVLTGILIAALLLGCQGESSDFLSFTGTVRWKALATGFYAIDADNGERYEPLNLPSSFAQDGLRVRVTAKERPEIVSIFMYGKAIEIVSIRRI
jgi:hypothetical protein